MNSTTRKHGPMTRSITTNTIRTACLLAALALAAVGCGLAPSTGVPADATLVPDDRVEALFDDSYSGIDEGQRRVVRTAGTWADVWEQLHEGRSPSPERPAVDFDDSLVVLAAMGSRPTGGYGIGVGSVHREGETLYVVVRESSPGENCGVTQAITAPAVAVRVPHVSGDVHFVEEESENECS